MHLAVLFYLAGGDIEDVGASFILFVLFICVLITIAILIMSILMIVKVLGRRKDKKFEVNEEKNLSASKD